MRGKYVWCNSWGITFLFIILPKTAGLELWVQRQGQRHSGENIQQVRERSRLIFSATFVCVKWKIVKAKTLQQLHSQLQERMKSRHLTCFVHKSCSPPPTSLNDGLLWTTLEEEIQTSTYQSQNWHKSVCICVRQSVYTYKVVYIFNLVPVFLLMKSQKFPACPEWLSVRHQTNVKGMVCTAGTSEF